MSHTYTRLTYHIVFGTEQCKPMIHDRMRDRLHSYMAAHVKSTKAQPLRINGTADHVHLLVECGPAQPLADVVRMIKSNSSKWVHETFPMSTFHWQGGYAAFTVSPSRIPDVMSYIEHQEEHHRQATFDEELKALLDRSGVDYDARYLDFGE